MKTTRTRISGLVRALTVLILLLALCATTPPARAGTVIHVNTTEDPPVHNGNCSFAEAAQSANTDADVPAVNDACEVGSGTDTIAFNIPGTGLHTITLTSEINFTAPVIIDGATQPGFVSGSPGVPVIRLVKATGSVLSFGPGSGGSTIMSLMITETYVGASPPNAITVLADNFTAVGNFINNDGTTDSGSNANGILLGISSNSHIGGPSAEARNLFGGDGGIWITSGSDNFIDNNYFGVRADGITPLTGMAGLLNAISINQQSGTTSMNRIRGNVITGYDAGILLNYPSTATTVTGNYIGVGADGSTSLGNGEGIAIYGSSSNTIGGLASGDRNVVSGNTGEGQIYLDSSGANAPTGNMIIGNFIGTNAGGSGAVSPSIYGIKFYTGSNNYVGGPGAGAGNLISGNSVGILSSSGSGPNHIYGNRIGTDVTGLVPVPNGTGISLYHSTALIGDPGTPGRNVISGNTNSGIGVDGSSGTMIYGNRIGMNAAGNGGVANGSGITLNNASVTVAQNWIAYQYPYDGLFMEGTASVGSDSNMNCFENNERNGVLNSTGTQATFTNNWWGSPSGPYHSVNNPGGTGDYVSWDVTFSPWLVKRPPACAHASTTGVFRPSNGALYMKNANTTGFADMYFTYGLPGDYPVVGDWDGSGTTTLGVYRGDTFYLRNSNTNGYADLTFAFGVTGMQPVAGDWNGDGSETIGLYDSTSGTFFLRNSNGSGYADMTFTLGIPGDVGIAGDWNGDGIDTVGVFRPSNGALYLRNSNSTGFADVVATYGIPGDKPVTGDWDADGDDTIGVYRDGTFYLRNTNDVGFADLTFTLGIPGDMPIAGDWDGLP